MRNSWYLILVTVAVLTTSCDKQTQTKSEKQPISMSATTVHNGEAVASTSTSESAPQTTNQAKTFELGLDKAAGAYSISQSAQSPGDWSLVASHYQDAMALMKQVQRDDPYYSIAQQKISEYQQKVKQAQLRTVASVPKFTPQPQATQVVVVPEPEIKPKVQSNVTIALAPKPTKIIAPVFAREPKQTQVEQQIQPVIPPEAFINQQTEEKAITIPIKRRIGGTPVIEVKFNGNQNFEMIVDTGASGTVITQKMAAALSIVPVGQAKANTASSKAVTFPIGYVNSMEVGEVRVNQIPVAIAGAGLETGLLGHDFFGDYDITIKRDVVQFRPHTPTDTKTAETQPAIPIYPKLRR